MEGSDLRIVKPRYGHNKFHGKHLYVVGCNVIEIGERISGRKHSIKIEIVNFKTGVLEVKPAITYTGTLEHFDGLGKIPPFRTEANVHLNEGKIWFEVYGVFNAGLIESFFGVEEILNHDELQILDVFHSYYQDINKWVDTELEKFNDSHDDLPF